MPQNSYKINKGKVRGFSLFSLIESSIKLDKLFEEGVPAKFLPHILFIAGLGIFYIGNNHWVERTIREVDKVQVEVEELRADYTSLKADYMFASKQSEVAKKVSKKGIKESLEPPVKIYISK
jgi:hypothetical protein